MFPEFRNLLPNRFHADPDAIVFWSCMFLSMVVWPLA
jgi:hypothetical protein